MITRVLKIALRLSARLIAVAADLQFSRRGAELVDGELAQFYQLQFFCCIPFLVWFVLENSAPVRLFGRLHSGVVVDLLLTQFRLRAATFKPSKITNHDAWQYTMRSTVGITAFGSLRPRVRARVFGMLNFDCSSEGVACARLVFDEQPLPFADPNPGCESG